MNQYVLEIVTEEQRAVQGFRRVEMSAKDLENHAVAFAALADDLREFRVIHASRSWP